MTRRERISTYHLPLAQVPKGRYELANPELAITESRKALTRAINRAKGLESDLSPGRVAAEGSSLKKGVIAFAQKTGVSNRMVEQLKHMEERDLLQLYDENKILFESYFDYGGLKDSGIGFEMDEVTRARKENQIQELIDQYAERFVTRVS